MKQSRKKKAVSANNQNEIVAIVAKLNYRMMNEPPANNKKIAH